MRVEGSLATGLHRLRQRPWGLLIWRLIIRRQLGRKSPWSQLCHDRFCLASKLSASLLDAEVELLVILRLARWRGC